MEIIELFALVLTTVSFFSVGINGTLGNWLTMATDADSSGSYQATESREHNAANELTQRAFDALVPPSPLEFDDAGNLILQRLPFSSTDVTYVHDGWNRLTEVRYNDVLRASFTYNALHQRVSKISDTRPYGTIDQRQVMYYSVDWQLLEEHIDDDYVAGGSCASREALRRATFTCKRSSSLLGGWWPKGEAASRSSITSGRTTYGLIGDMTAEHWRPMN